jgi:hypothetical protein
LPGKEDEMKSAMTVLAIAALCICAWAADNAEVGTRPTANYQSPISNAQSLDAITIPQMLSYQGKLTDTLGQPVPNGNYQLTSRLYTQPAGGSAFWSEAQTVLVKGGLFSALLGTLSPIESVPAAGNLYLSLQVAADPELSPRLRIASSAYSYLASEARRADTADYALAGLGDDAWVRGTPDSVLYTVRNLGIARGGAGNMLYGNDRNTHVNLGVACTTGTSGTNYSHCTVGGGYRNTASGDYVTVGGGYSNTASGILTTVGGGQNNTVSGYLATVGGGYGNTASGYCATVPGGYASRAAGGYSFAAGVRAKANHDGCFVWSDSSTGYDSVYSTDDDQWRVRARGGTWFFSNAGMTTGAYLAPNSNSWQSACDSMTKEDFRPVDRKVLLEKLATLRVRNYKMKDQNDGTRHIGPVAQDFHSAFGVGETETGINLADADGVLLAAVQALYEDNKALRTDLEVMKARLAGQR